jgi:eukaryotic-like serine/threonine-protein kinase
MIAEAGQTLGGLVLRHKIAEGGMGMVWAAEHIGLNREVAVKFLSSQIATSPEAIQRFTHEARTLARISCPNTPQVFDYGVTTDGTPYMVMELITGSDLSDWVSERGCMSPAQVGRLLEQAALALSAAHELGIVHRDIKPENIMIAGGNDDFHVKVVDFGIAKSPLSRKLGYVTQVGATVGTPKYMSPEQLTGSIVDPRSDMWSLAVVAYWCLTGRAPFEGDASGSIYLAIHEGHATPVSELRADLPVALDEWFHRALAYDMSKRFETVELMSRMFNVAASSRCASAAPEDVAIPLVHVVHTPRSSDVIEMSFAGVTQSDRPKRAARPRRGYVLKGALAATAFGLILVVGDRFSSGTAPIVRQVENTQAATGGGGGVAIPQPLPPPSASSSSTEVLATAPAGLEAPASPEGSPAPAPSSEPATAAAPASTRSRVTSVRGVHAFSRPVVSSPVATLDLMSAAPPPPPPAKVNRQDWTPRDSLGEP